MSEYPCEHPRCSSVRANPQFTTSIEAIKKGEHQPRWFCGKHAPLYIRVTFWGQVVKLPERR